MRGSRKWQQQEINTKKKKKKAADLVKCQKGADNSQRDPKDST